MAAGPPRSRSNRLALLTQEEKLMIDWQWFKKRETGKLSMVRVAIVAVPILLVLAFLLEAESGFLFVLARDD